VIMVFIAFLIVGIVSYLRIPVSLLPNIDIPEITIHISYPGYSARETEDLITTPLRRQLMQCNHLDDIKTKTEDGSSVISLQFNYGTKIDYAYIEVNEKLDQAAGRLPKDMERPRVIKASASDIPVFYLDITLNDSSGNNKNNTDFIELSRFVSNVISKRIEQLPEIAMVDISGLTYPEIEITPDEASMKALGLNNKNIEDLLTSNNYKLGNVTVRDGYYRYSIRFSNQLNNADDLGNIIVNTGNRLFKLKDLAKIEIKEQKQEGIFTSGGKKGISLAIIKQPDIKMDDLKKSVDYQVKKIQREYPQLSVKVTQDQTALLDYSIGNLKQDLFWGALLAIVVVFIFIANWRLPLIIGVIIPISLILSFIFLQIFGISVNIISLSGLVLGVGMMIDNSIIVIDNITQHRERGLSPENASINGTNEIIVPLLSSMLTNCAVYIPLIFISGITGALFFDQAISVTIGLCVSLVTAITLIPVIYYIFFKKDGKSVSVKLPDSIVNFRKGFPLEKIYEHGVGLVFKHPLFYTIGFLVLMGLSIILLFYIPKERFPKVHQNELMVRIDWNEPLDLNENRIRTDSVFNNLGIKLINYDSWLGTQDYLTDNNKDVSQGEVFVYMQTNSFKSLDSAKNKINKTLQLKFPKAEFSYSSPENIFEKTFSDKNEPFIIELKGKELAEFEKTSEFITEFDSLLDLKTVSKLKTNTVITLNYAPEKLMIYKIQVSDLVTRCKSLLNDYQAGTIKTSGEVIPLKFAGNIQNVYSLLQYGTIENSENIEIPLRDLLTVSYKTNFKAIYGGKNGEYLPVAYQGIKRNGLNNLEQKISNFLHSKNKSLECTFSGSIYSLQKIFKELWVVLLVSFALLYLILAAQFESLIQPLIVLLEIPIDIAGMVFILFIFGQSVNIVSVTGIVVMCGIVINDSILKIDTINRIRKEEKLPLLEAIKEGGKRRLRPILMTSLTAMLTLLPGMFSGGLGAEIQQPFSLTIMGGLFVGTLVSLFFIPVVYWFIYKNQEN